ncbi:MAG: AEC family transporter [Candidatus Lokiarchaeota archaeon]|nr:AEC family transporter [Candidatus Lokiarchaeota archaeon]
MVVYVDLSTINNQFLLSMLIIALGFILKKLKLLSTEDGAGLSKLVINLTLPALILKTISNIELDFSLILLPFICFGLSMIILILSYFTFKREKRHLKGILLITSIGFNIGLFAYPLIEGIFGATGLVYVAMFDVGNAFLIFGICYTLASIFAPRNGDERIGESKGASNLKKSKLDKKYLIKRIFMNIPLISYIVALIINLSIGGINESSFIFGFLDVISKANEALVLVILGVFLNFQIKKENVKKILKVLIIRYGGGLGIGTILFVFLPFGELFRTIVLISFILPIGMAVLPFSVQNNYDENLQKLTGTLTNLTIVISFALMWIIITLLNL